MNKFLHEKRAINNPDAVSEIVGVVLLLSLAVLGATIVGAVILSQPLPEETPSVNILISGTGLPDSKVLIQHNGGDSLAIGDFKVYADGNVLDNNLAVISGGDKKWPFSHGETLTYDVALPPENVRVIYTGSQSSVDLKSSYISGDEFNAGGVDTVPSPIPTRGIGGDCEEYLENHYVEYFQEQLEDDSIYLTRTDKGSDGGFRGTLRFRVKDSGSYLVIGDDYPTELSDGDRVELVFANGKTPAVMIFMLGDSLTISAKGNGRNDLKIYIEHNGVWGPDISGKDDLSDSWINGCDMMESTLSFSMGGDWEHTRLVINNNTIVDEENRDEFAVYNIIPSKPDLMVLRYPSKSGHENNIFFIGKAGMVTRDGYRIYP